MKGVGATAATRGTGRTGGVVGVTPTGIELGLKVGGIGQLGISTDYGGGVVVGIFGQKIVWGREGGKISYNFGGLEVKVEARNCVVVETREILGKVLDRRVYPDPGCKLPSENEPKKVLPTSIHKPIISTYECTTGKWVLGGRFIDPDKLETPEEVMYIFLRQWATFRANPNFYSIPEGKEGWNFETNPTVNSDQDEGYAQQSFGGATYRIEKRLIEEEARAGDWWWYNTNAVRPSYTFDRGGDTLYYLRCYYVNYYIRVDTGSEFRGSPIDWFYRFIKHKPVPPCPVGPSVAVPNVLIVILPPHQPSAGNQPSMPESCCESLSADIADLMEVLAVKEVLAGKLTVPWAGRMPGGQGEEIILDYPNLLRTLWQFIDHLGIHPPKLTIKDINNAIAGDQSLTNQFPSVTQAFEALMAQVWDANADVDTLTNFLYRLAWLSVQQSFNLASLTGSVESLKDMVGGETEVLETTLTTPFNIEAGTAPKKAPPSGKGFGKPSNNGKGAKGAIDNRIEAKTEMATEAMLPEFLKIRENPILIDSFTGKQDIFDLLLLIRSDLEKIKNSR